MMIEMRAVFASRYGSKLSGKGGDGIVLALYLEDGYVSVHIH